MTIQQHASFDSSAAELNATSKLVKAWESKNAKNAAKAGGISLMALSLAACGGSDSTTTAVVTDPVTPVTPTGNTFSMTPLNDVASSTTAVNGSIANDFRFSSADDTVNAITASIQAADTLLDGSTTDTDVINITSTGAMNAMTAVNIETANVTMASGAATAVFTNFTGLTAVTVTGSVAGTVTNAGTATISTSDYTRVLTVEADLSGTAAASTADTLNMAVSGATFGTTAATQSTLLIDNTDANTDTVETLNIASNGSAANVFYVDASADTDFETINVTGSAAATVRLDHADVTGITIAAGTNTSDVDLSIDRNGATTTATNVLNMSGAETITLRDSTAGGDTANLTGVASGQKVILSTDFTGATIGMAGASRTAQAASVTVELDNSTAATDTDIGGNLNIQDTAAINIVSNGNASSATAATVENGFTLVGDAATVTLTGDTHIDATLNIDAAGATGTTARAVVVDASGMTGTAYVELDAAASALVSYTMTGTANNDTLVANAAGSSLTGGAGNDTLTGGAGNDTILGGAGIDTIDANAGTNTVTLGAGADVVVIGDLDVTAVAGSDTLTLAANWAAADTVAFTIGGVTETYTVTTGDVAGNTAADLVAVEDSLVNFLNSTFDGLTAANGANATLTLTYDTTVDATVVSTVTATTAGTGTAVLAETVAGTDAVAVATTVTDFDSAATGDTINISVAGINAGIGAVLDDADSTATSSGDTVVLLDYTVGSAFSDTDGVADGQNVIKASYSTAVNSAANFSTQLGSNTITLDAAIASGNAITAVFYDADDSQMVLSFLVHDSADAILDGATAVNEVARFDMTQAEYAAIDATDFAFIA